MTGRGHGYDQPSRGQRRHGNRDDNNPPVPRDVFKSIYLLFVPFFLDDRVVAIGTISPFFSCSLYSALSTAPKCVTFDDPLLRG